MAGTVKGISLGPARRRPVIGVGSALRSAFAVLALLNSGASLAASKKLKCAYTPKASVDRFVELFKRCAVREGEDIRIRRKHLKALDFGTTGLADIYLFGVGSYYVLPDGTKASVVAHEGGGPDSFSEGLVRTLVDGKIAYLSEKLETVLVTDYDWGWQFDNGTALVCEGCRREPAGEHVTWVGGKWGYIDQLGKDVVPWQDTLREARSKLEELANARAASSSDAHWPAAGICARVKVAQDERCRTLFPSDGLSIQAALEVYLQSQTAQRSHSKEDLNEAAGFVGPPHLQQVTDHLVPKVGGFFVYLGDTDTTLLLENTVAVTERGRRGFRFHLQDDGEMWVVISLGGWHAW